jgi:nucleotide-binding universal stress UspA family protein
MRILCATDLLPKSDAAIDRAGLLSDELRADVTLLHVAVPGESALTMERELLRATDEMRLRSRFPRWRAALPPNVAVLAGSAANLIIDTAVRSKSRLLVVGPHRKRPLRDALEGTIVEKALATRRFPVLVVREAVRRGYRRVLLALDASDASASAIRAAESLVLTPAAEAVVVHVHKPPYEGMLYSAHIGMETVARYTETWSREATHLVRGMLDYESDDASRYDVHIEHGPPAPGICKAIETFSPDLLVVGTGGTGRLRRALVGSVANRVLHDSTCDVLIVPEGSVGALRSKAAFGGARTLRAGDEAPARSALG